MDDPSLIMVILASLALFVRVGMAAYAVGSVRSKNAASTVFRNVCDFSIVILTFWPTYIRTDAHSLFWLVRALIVSGIIVSVLAERMKFIPLCIASMAVGAGILPLAFHIQGRFFESMSMDHVTGAVCALVGAMLVGSRSGKYNRDGSSNLIPAHNLSMLSLGVMIILVGWLPYTLMNPRGFSWHVILNVLMSAAAGAVVALVFSHIRYGKPDVLLTYSGLLGGLVAVLGNPLNLPTPVAIAIGAIAGYLVPAVTVMLDLKFHIDDPVGAIAIHGMGGLWGTIAAGIFATPRAAGWQIVGALLITLVVAIAASAVFFILRATIGIRSSEADEYDGLDLAEHDLNAYPDFQQTMIKSYHMREA